MMRKLSLLTCAALLAIGLGACGDDDDDDGSATATTAGADNAEYCEASLDIETTPDPEIDFENASEEEIAQGTKEYATDTLRPIANRIIESAPAEVEADIDVLDDALKEVEESGDFSPFEEDDEVIAAQNRVNDFNVEECDWQGVNVTAVEYAFQGIPTTLRTGATNFKLTNNGKELHEIVIFKKNEGVTESFDQLLADEEAAEGKVDEFGGTFVPQGKTNFTADELTAGSYVAVCFIPVGTTSEESESEGPPHFTRGMKAEFTVS